MENLTFKESVYRKARVSDILMGVVGNTSVPDGNFPADSKLEAQKSWLVDSEMSASIANVYTRANQYNPVAYIPTAVGMKAGMIFGSNSWDILQFARFSNFLIYFILCLLAIWVIPQGKGVLATALCIPTAIFLASALTTDSFLIGVCAVYVAYFMKILDSNISVKIAQSVLISFLTLLLLLLKPPFGALALIYLFLPSKIWPTKQKLISAFATLACFGLLYGLWAANFQMVYTNSDYYENVEYAIAHLPKIVFTCFSNTIYYLCLIAPTYYPYILVPIMIVMFVSCSAKGECMTPKYILLVALLSAFLALAITYLFLLLTWNGICYGIADIHGFQERYVLPLLPLLALFVKSKQKSPKPAHVLAGETFCETYNETSSATSNETSN